MKNRLFLAYDNSCGVKLEVAVSRAVKEGGFSFCCGQADMGPDGYPQKKYDLKSQTAVSVKLMEDVFERIGTPMEKLVRVQVHYINDGKFTEKEYAEYFRSLLPDQSNPLLIFTPLPKLFYDGLCVEIDGIACVDSGNKKMDTGKNVICESIKAGNLIFSLYKSTKKGTPLKEQIRDQFEQLDKMMEDLSVDQKNVLKIYTYYSASDRLAALKDIVSIRNDFYSDAIPPCSDVPVAAFNSEIQGEEFRLEVVLAEDVSTVRRFKSSELPGACQLPHSKSMDLARETDRLIFFATQHPYSQDGELLYPGNIEKQTVHCMDALKKGLAFFDSSFEDMMKMTTFYKGDEDDFHKNLSIRNSYLRSPGAASTGVPLDQFTYPEQLIQVEGIACIKREGLEIIDLAD